MSQEIELQIYPKNHFLRLQQVLQLIPISKSTWWKGIKSGKFPQGYSLGRCTVWLAQDIEKLIASVMHK